MKKSRFILLISLIALATIMYGCYYDKTDILYPKLPSTTCDTTNITYSKTLNDILSSYCLGCHGSTYQNTGGGIRLDNYNAVKARIDLIISDISHITNPMPKGSAKLDDCSIKKFVIWKSLNTPNN